MNDHVIPMFSISRDEMLSRMNAKLASIAESRALIEKAQADAVGDREKTALGSGLKELATVEARVAFLRDHLAPVDAWAMSAQQAIEMLTLTEKVVIDPLALKFAVDPSVDIRTSLHNVNGGRKLRI